MVSVVVQKLMGHKNISVTLNTYTSVFDKFKPDEINKVNRYYMDGNLVANRIIDHKSSDTEQLEDR